MVWVSGSPHGRGIAGGRQGQSVTATCKSWSVLCVWALSRVGWELGERHRGMGSRLGNRARRHGGPATTSPALWPPAPMSSGKGGNTPRASDRVSRVGPGQQCPQEVGSLLPPCSLGLGTWDSRPAASPRASWLPDKIGRASPQRLLETPPPALSCPLQLAGPPVGPPCGSTTRPPTAQSAGLGEGTALPEDPPTKDFSGGCRIEARCQSQL